MTGKRLVLYAVALLLSAAAALSIGILLFGEFGETEGRILATTTVLAGFGVLALPGAILVDRRTLLPLAGLLLVLALVSATLTVVTIWSNDVSEAVGKLVGTAEGWLLVTVQVAALALRRRPGDPLSVRRLFAASTVVVVVAAALFTGLVWTEFDSERAARILGALVVLDVLLVALQPILALVRPAAGPPPDESVPAPDSSPERERALR